MRQMLLCFLMYRCILAKISLHVKNGPVIATFSNFRYLHWLDQFVKHLGKANISNYVVVPLDKQTGDWLQASPGHALHIFGKEYFSVTDGNAFTINTPEYNKLLHL